MGKKICDRFTWLCPVVKHFKFSSSQQQQQQQQQHFYPRGIKNLQEQGGTCTKKGQRRNERSEERKKISDFFEIEKFDFFSPQ